MSTALDTTSHTHGGLDCADAEAILHDATTEAADLRARLAMALQAHDDLLRQNDVLRLEGDRLRALHDDTSAKNRSLADERDGLIEQVKFLGDELNALEADAVPEGTLVYGVVAREEMVRQYRTASRINRGPVPPSVIDAVEAARDDIAETMAAAGRAAVNDIVVRAVRRRRRAQNRRSRNQR